MKKIFVLLFYFCCHFFTQAQNSVETNPNGTSAIISSIGMGSSLINNSRTGFYANTGSISTNNSVRAIQGIASNSTDLNIGVYGFANGNNSNFNYAFEGDANVNTGTGASFFGNCFTSSISADYLYGAQFNTATYNGTNGGAIAYGVQANIYGNGAITQKLGFNSKVEGSASDYSSGISTSVSNTGNGLAYGGFFNTFGPGTGIKYGIYSIANNQANALSYGGYFEALGTGTGTKYGIYAKASGSGTLYAAVLDGKVGIGTSSVSTNEILEVNGRMRLRRGAFASGLWLNNSANGTAITDGAFVGLNNESSGSETVGFWLNGAFRFLVDRAGNTTIDGELNRTQTSNANLLPIAYGTIGSNGTITLSTSTDNFTSNKTNTGIYEITLSSENYTAATHLTTTTLLSSTFGFIRVLESNNKLIVYTADISGSPLDKSFSFVIYKK